MGADKGVHIHTDLDIDKDIQPIHIASILNKYIQDNGYDIVILGKQSIDDDFNHTGQMLSELSGRSIAPFISKLDYDKDKKQWLVEREIDGGIQTIKVPSNSIFTCDLRLNTPRLIKLPNILKAKKKPLDKLTLDDFKDEISKINSKLNILEITEPPKREGGVILESVDELLDKLRNVDKVL